MAVRGWPGHGAEWCCDNHCVDEHSASRAETIALREPGRVISGDCLAKPPVPPRRNEAPSSSPIRFRRIAFRRRRADDSTCCHDKEERVRFGVTFVDFSLGAEQVLSFAEHCIGERLSVAISSCTDPKRSFQNHRFFAARVPVSHGTCALFHSDQEGQSLICVSTQYPHLDAWRCLSKYRPVLWFVHV